MVRLGEGGRERMRLDTEVRDGDRREGRHSGYRRREGGTGVRKKRRDKQARCLGQGGERKRQGRHDG